MSKSNNKLIEANVPENLRVQVIHLHRGNSSNRQRKGHEYVTVARLSNRADDTIVAEGKSFCSKHDAPSRSKGRAIAVGRALREYMLDAYNVMGIQNTARMYLEQIPAFGSLEQVQQLQLSKETTSETL